MTYLHLQREPCVFKSKSVGQTRRARRGIGKSRHDWKRRDLHSRFIKSRPKNHSRQPGLPSGLSKTSCDSAGRTLLAQTGFGSFGPHQVTCGTETQEQQTKGDRGYPQSPFLLRIVFGDFTTCPANARFSLPHFSDKDFRLPQKGAKNRKRNRTHTAWDFCVSCVSLRQTDSSSHSDPA